MVEVAGREPAPNPNVVEWQTAVDIAGASGV